MVRLGLACLVNYICLTCGDSSGLNCQGPGNGRVDYRGYFEAVLKTYALTRRSCLGRRLTHFYRGWRLCRARRGNRNNRNRQGTTITFITSPIHVLQLTYGPLIDRCLCQRPRVWHYQGIPCQRRRHRYRGPRSRQARTWNWRRRQER